MSASSLTAAEKETSANRRLGPEAVICRSLPRLPGGSLCVMLPWRAVTMYRLEFALPEERMTTFSSLSPNATDPWLDGRTKSLLVNYHNWSTALVADKIAEPKHAGAPL